MQEVGNPQTPHSVVAVDYNFGLRVELVQTAGDITHRHMDRVRELNQRHFFGLADIEQHEVFTSVSFGLEFVNGNFERHQILFFGFDDRTAGLILDNGPLPGKVGGMDLTTQKEANMAESERYQKGAAKMKELFGVEPRPGSMHEDFLDITVKNLFGDVWGRDGLAIQERSMITMAALTVLGRDPELKVHIRGALNIGVSRDKINEIMIHLAHYGGWPVGVNGLRLAKQVFDSIDEKKPKS